MKSAALTTDIRSERPLYLLDSAGGLPSNQVHQIACDKQNRLWLATPAGLARYDGHFVREWDRRDGLQSNGLRSVAIDPHDVVWIGTDFGFERLDIDGRVLPGVMPGSWEMGLCQAIDVSQPSPWFGTAAGLVKLEVTTDGSGYVVSYVAAVGFVSEVKCLDHCRVIAVLAAGSLIESDGYRFWHYQCPGIDGRTVKHLAIGQSGELLLGTDNGLYVIDKELGVVTAHVTIAQIDLAVSAIVVGEDRYWIAFGRTVVAFTADSTNPRIVEQFVCDSVVNDLLLDAAGNVFLATNSSGLCQISCLRHAVQKIDLGVDGGVYSIKLLRSDAFAIGGEQIFGNTTLPEQGSQALLSRRGSIPQTTIWDSLEDQSGTWIATGLGLFHAAPDGEFTQVFVDDQILNAPARVLLEWGDALWIGTLRGLARVQDGVATSIDGNGIPLGYVYVMCDELPSRLWVGTLGRGLWYFQGGLATALTTFPLSATGNTYAVAPGPSGSVVVLQDDKIILLNCGLQPTLIAALPPIVGWTVAWVDTNTLAIGASDGLRIVDIPSGRVTCLVQSLLRRRDWEFTNNRTLVRDQEGRFLCGVNGGLVRVDLSRLRSYAPPVCQLVDVVWSNATPVRNGSSIEVKAGRWTFHLRVFSAWFIDSTPPMYQFQLVGFDNTWSQLQVAPEISFNSLPPGRYRVLCRSSTALAGLGPVAELLDLVVVRPFWLTGWATVLAKMVQGFDRLVRSKARNELLLKQNLALELEVEERTQSLRSANKALETMRDAYKRLSDVDELTKLGNRRFFERETTRAISLTQRLRVPLALLILDIDHFKSVNDHYGHHIGDDYLRAVGAVLASSIRDGEDVAARFGGEEFAILFINSSSADTLIGAERIRADVEALELENKGSKSGKVTVSIGIATVEVGASLSRDELVIRADEALYRAKSGGRNRVEIWI